MAFLEGAFQCYGIFGECFRGVTFRKRRLFSRGVAFLEGTYSILEGCGIFGGHLLYFGGVLAVFWRGVAFLEGTCSVCLQCFGSA